jgi:hypothetical protein
VFATDYWHQYGGKGSDLYRPLTIASYRLNHALFGLSSPAFHVVNIMLHGMVCVVLAFLVEAVLRDRALALASALLFATHPVHTEAVTGIVGRAEVLAGLFVLLPLYLHARDYVLGGWGRAFWLPVALILYLCGLLSKESAIVGLGLVVLVDYVKRRADTQTPSPASGLGRKVGVLGLYVGVAAIYLMIRYAVLGQFVENPGPRPEYLLVDQPLTTRILTGLKILVIYLKLLLFPLTLSADYSYRQIPLIHGLDSVASIGAVMLGVVAAASLGAGFLWSIRKRAWAVVLAIGFFAVPYSIVSNLVVPIGVLVAERLMYLPSVGFCVGLAFFFVHLTHRQAASTRIRHLPRVVFALVVLLYGVRTVARNPEWWSPEKLYAATAAASPDCHAAHFNYAAVLLRGGGGQEKTERALEHLHRAYEIRSDHYPSLINLAIAHLNAGQPEKAAEFAREGLELRPDSEKLRGILRSAEERLARKSHEGG